MLVGRKTRFLIQRPSIVIGRAHANSERVRGGGLHRKSANCLGFSCSCMCARQPLGPVLAGVSCSEPL